jgi:hypothetical protein
MVTLRCEWCRSVSLGEASIRCSKIAPLIRQTVAKLIDETPEIPRNLVRNSKTSAHIVEQSAKRWTEIRSRLELNADADLSDLN